MNEKDRTILDLRLFGPGGSAVDGQTLRPLRTRKGQWILALLALRHGRDVEREWLAGTLWPESDQAKAFYNLRRTLADLRDALGPAASCLVASTPHSLRLDLANVACDLTTFDQAVNSPDSEDLERALSLYAGPLMEGCMEEWVVEDRESREQAVIQALETLASRAAAQQDYSRAARLFNRLVSTDPLRESAHRGLLESLAASGDYAAVDRHYRELRLVLLKQINVEPAHETAELYRRLKKDGRTRQPTKRIDQTEAPKRRIPCPLTPLIGRAADIEDVCARLRRDRLLTLTGVGGVGKTRLAIATAARVAEKFPDGVWFVDLAPVANTGDVIRAVAETIGVKDESGHRLSSSICEFAHSRSMLIVLDNCEHLADASAELAVQLLERSPESRILATSRQPLKAPGERVFRVPALSVPENPSSDEKDNLPRLMLSSAAQLFVDRAYAADSGFRLRTEHVRSISRICRLLDGVPLALELAAGWASSLPLDEIALHLSDRLELPGTPSRTRPSRQRSLRATLEWSCRLLSDDEMRVLRRLSVFAGGWTMDAAHSVSAFSESEVQSVPQHIARLVDQNLISFYSNFGENRYSLLETTRQYLRDQLDQASEETEARDRHLAYFLGLAEQAAPELQGPQQAEWLDRLDRDHDNLRAALTWSLADTSRAAYGLRLAVALTWFWFNRSYPIEGLEILTRALSCSASHPDAHISTVRAGVLNSSGILAWQLGKYDDAANFHQESLAVYRELDNEKGVACNLNNLASIARCKGEPFKASRLYEESLAANRKMGNLIGIASALHNLAMVLHGSGEYDRARSLLTEALSINRGMGNRAWQANNLGSLGMAAKGQGSYAEARHYFNEALALARAINFPQGVAANLSGLGKLHQLEDNHAAASACLSECLPMYKELQDKILTAGGLDGFAGLARRTGRGRAAAIVYGAGTRLLESMGAVRPGDEVGEYESSVASLRSSLGNEAFDVAWAEGALMGADEAIDFAIANLDR